MFCSYVPTVRGYVSCYVHSYERTYCMYVHMHPNMCRVDAFQNIKLCSNVISHLLLLTLCMYSSHLVKLLWLLHTYCNLMGCL